jgi:uncharacterized radical SAM protein YgiQ
MNEVKEYILTDWLPVTKKEALLRGWEELDVVLFSGDAYVDHPSFGTAVIGRLIESMGLRIAIVPQPNWRDDLRDFKKFGAPRLFFAVTAGAMDSMVNHYTAAKRLRSDDAYSPAGRSGMRPDYAVTVYTQILKDLYPETPVIAGGIEASLRRFTHYDYWSDSLKPPILAECGADLLLYGMGEKPLMELVKLAEKNIPLQSLKNLRQSAYSAGINDRLPEMKNVEDIELYSHEDCLADKKKFMENFLITERVCSGKGDVRLIQKCGDYNFIVNPSWGSLSPDETDRGFDLPYTRMSHPKYKNGGVPAYDMIRHSVATHRGCFGGCSFCAISAHQGKFISSRSEGSIIREIEQVADMPDFKGYVSDLGGPSANMYRMGGEDLTLCSRCRRASCLFPEICSNLNYDHKPLVDLYRKSEKIRGVKKVFVSSGVRYDLCIAGNSDSAEKFHCMEYMEKLVKDHVSGRLKVAPEHTSERVLKLMRKPSYNLFVKFKNIFKKISERHGLKQQIIPYFISSHPGSDIEDMAELASLTAAEGFKLEQVQDFTPTPMTLASVIYYTGVNPYTGDRIYSAKNKKDRDNQRIFFFWHNKENRSEIKKLLKKTGRADIEKKLFSR